MWDYDHKSLPAALTQKFTRLDNIHNVKTRGAVKGNLYLPKVNTTRYGMKSFKYQGVEILNNLKIFKLAVSLGSVESLIQHPASMTHSCMSDEDKQSSGIYDNLIRCSIGLEDPFELTEDLISTINLYCGSL